MTPSDRVKGSIMSVLARNGDLDAAMEVPDSELNGLLQTCHAHLVS